MSNHTMTACDRCPSINVTEWWKPEGQLTLLLCPLHCAKHGPKLTARGFSAHPPLGHDADEPRYTLTGGDPARECG